jgi:hypothetical protein
MDIQLQVYLFYLDTMNLAVFAAVALLAIGHANGRKGTVYFNNYY